MGKRKNEIRFNNLEVIGHFRFANAKVYWDQIRSFSMDRGNNGIQSKSNLNTYEYVLNLNFIWIGQGKRNPEKQEHLWCLFKYIKKMFI